MNQRVVQQKKAEYLLQSAFRQPQTATVSRDKVDSFTGPMPSIHDFSKISILPPSAAAFQPKLMVNTPGDRFEQEADQVAGEVMRMEVPRAPSLTTHRNDEEIQRKDASGDTTTLSPGVESTIDQMRGGGQPLDLAARDFMEPRFGHSFADVRIHTDDRAVRAARDVDAMAFTVGRDIAFGAGQYQPSNETGRQLLAHELTHVVQQSGGVNRKPIQQTTSPLVQRDKNSDKIEDLEARTRILEKKSAADHLDLKYRATFGEKISNYKQIVYRLTGAFQSALSGYQGAQGKQAAQDAILDQIAMTLIVTAGAAALEPFLSFSLGKLQGSLGKVSQSIQKVNIAKFVEKVENPANAAASGTGNVVTTARAGDRAANSQAAGLPGGGGAGKGGDDPLSFLASNMEAIESHNQQIESAFKNRSTAFDAMTAADWDTWSKEAQEAVYSALLKDLDTVALGDIGKLEGANTLAVKIELYLWAAWIKKTYQPGVSGLQIGSQLAKRLKHLGVESLAGVTFDTESWVFMEHQPKGTWESNLGEWAKTWSQPLTK